MKCFSILFAITFILLKARISFNSTEENNQAIYSCIKLRLRAPFLKLNCEKLLDKAEILSNNTELVSLETNEIMNDTFDSSIKEVITLPQKDITNSTRKVCNHVLTFNR